MQTHSVIQDREGGEQRPAIRQNHQYRTKELSRPQCYSLDGLIVRREGKHHN